LWKGLLLMAEPAGQKLISRLKKRISGDILSAGFNP
jgi:hypothetical protein